MLGAEAGEAPRGPCEGVERCLGLEAETVEGSRVGDLREGEPLEVVRGPDTEAPGAAERALRQEVRLEEVRTLGVRAPEHDSHDREPAHEGRGCEEGDDRVLTSFEVVNRAQDVVRDQGLDV